MLREFFPRTDSEKYSDELKYREIDLYYRGKQYDNDPINIDQLKSLNCLIDIAQEEIPMGKDGWNIRSFIIKQYKLKKIDDINQGMYMAEIVPLVLSAMPTLWMTIPEKIIYHKKTEKYEKFKKELISYSKNSNLVKFFDKILFRKNIPRYEE